MLLTVCALIAACAGGDAGRRSRDSAASAAGTVVSAAEFSSATKYLGIRYDSLPPTFTFVSGSLIPNGPGANSVGFDLDLVRTPRGEMIWLDSIVAVSQRGRPSRIVRAELKVPPLAPDERLVMSSCDVDGRLDPRVVAIVVVEPGVTQYTLIRQAWRADATSGRFEVIPVTGVVCEPAGT
jgi:hypothetical protein